MKKKISLILSTIRNSVRTAGFKLSSIHEGEHIALISIGGLQLWVLAAGEVGFLISDSGLGPGSGPR